MGRTFAGAQGVSALIWCPFPSREEARAAAKVLIEEQWAACANLIDPMKSLFLWDGEFQKSQECGALFKTDAALLKGAIDRLTELHPYSTPAILGWRCDEAADQTASWLGALLPPQNRPKGSPET